MREQRRQQEAQAFLETVNRSKLGKDWQKDISAADPGQLAQRNVGEGMMIDPSLLVATQRFAGLSPAWLAACVATLNVGLRQFALLGGTNQVMRVCLSQACCHEQLLEYDIHGKDLAEAAASASSIQEWHFQRAVTQCHCDT